EQMPDGKLFYLSYFMGRAGYAKNILKRHLLTPGKIESIPFQNSYITVKQLSNGSRIVALVNVNKSPFEQINYGTGKDVNDETINDAKEPLRVKWYNSSYIKIPILK
ncbi:MAG: peptidase S15, partial [Flavisolibacter sp.]|nr:peptidase S15 [Flavisolibacter sp.]